VVIFFFVTFFTSIQYISLVHMDREEAKFFWVSVNVSSFVMELYLGILGKLFEICMTTSTRSIITIL